MAGGRGPRQLALALPHTESFAREDFLAGASNSAAAALVDSWPDWPARVVALVGPEGSGKSHLASIWAASSGARFVAARAVGDVEPFGALATGALVLEDMIEGVFDERGLFHLLNLAREQHAYILLTSRTAPVAWSVELRDLASRLKAIPNVMLMPPDDALLRAVLVKLFQDRQLVVDESLIGYLATRIERSFVAAKVAVERLDREAIQRRRPLTRRLAAELFG